MDIQIKEYTTGQRATIWANHSDDIIFIDPRPKWTDPIPCKPFHGESDSKDVDLDRFMYLAIGWENMLNIIWKNEGFMAVVMLDMSCIKRKDFYDMFLGIHHE